MTTAHEVVVEYLKDKAEHEKPIAAKEILTRRTREIVDELPDGFTRRDVGVCVNTLTERAGEATELTPSQRSRAVSKALNDMVADGIVKLEGEIYSHPYPRPPRAASGPF